MIVLLLCSFVFMIYCLFLLRKKDFKILISIDNCVILFFMIVFSLVFPFDYFYLTFNNIKDFTYGEIILRFGTIEIIYYYLFAFVFLSIFIFTFRFINKNSSFEAVTHNIFQNDSNNNRMFYAAITVFFIGIICDYLYIKVYGSYSNYLNYSLFVRIGVSTIDNPWSFLYPFRGCIVLASIMFFSKLKINGKYSFFRILLFIISFIYALLILYSNKGRLSLILFIMIFPIIVLMKKSKDNTFNFKLLFFSLLGSIVFVLLIVQTGQLLSRSDDTSFVNSFVSETSFPFANFLSLLESNTNYRYGLDLISYPIYLLPTSIWRNVINFTVSDITTILTCGNLKGDNGQYGESPCDALSLGYLQGNIIGLVFTAFFLGVFVALIFKKIRSIGDNEYRTGISCYISIYLVLQSIFYCDPYNVVQRIFPFVIFIIIYFGYSFVKGRSHYQFYVKNY